jgi:hypothetical protein
MCWHVHGPLKMARNQEIVGGHRRGVCCGDRSSLDPPRAVVGHRFRDSHRLHFHLRGLRSFERGALVIQLATRFQVPCCDVYSQVIQLSAACAVACLLETFTTQVDNLILPLYFFVTLVLLSPKPV